MENKYWNSLLYVKLSGGIFSTAVWFSFFIGLYWVLIFYWLSKHCSALEPTGSIMLQIGILLVSLSEYLVSYIDCQGKLCMVRVHLFKVTPYL